MVPKIDVIACLSDNYAYLLRDEESGAAVVFDAPEAAPILAAVEASGGRLDALLLTHHHGDHIEGAADIVGRTGAKLIGAAADAHRLPPLDRAVADGEGFSVGPFGFRVIATPGHTRGHIVYHAPAARALFSGDTLFSLGCGRLFEGSVADMWESLLRLAALPPETGVYPGHEYTASNGRFALTVDPDNAALAERIAEVEALRAAGRPTVPVPLRRELLTNPFLRAGDPGLAARLGLAGHPAVEVFAELRRRKDGFR
ncbi:hydroxyacylglutathione hydrolase [Pleomorphomonas carboxyditropha]|uniref:Hydroxyacylglutathione hydrolase n=1 Tax=Pleomorphomonas carboxyditropha TaxID=2023338 RepID=A0A2G9WUM6_9HYPH|nr:hydroxyacylglutathione hydrolase [Pleomorphomonas carboxyditropha]PIO98405.1 hydroxyacylglutathione hydrolase [Pleomorphomonas carboxyditropha]